MFFSDMIDVYQHFLPLGKIHKNKVGIDCGLANLV